MGAHERETLPAKRRRKRLEATGHPLGVAGYLCYVWPPLLSQSSPSMRVFVCGHVGCVG